MKDKDRLKWAKRILYCRYRDHRTYDERLAEAEQIVDDMENEFLMMIVDRVAGKKLSGLQK